MNSNNLTPFFPKNHEEKRPFIEAILLFSVFFLPGYFQQGAGFNIENMLNPAFHFFTLVFSLPQMLLLLYILYIRVGPHLRTYGIVPLHETRVFHVLLSYILILCITFSIGIVDQILHSDNTLLNSPGIEIPQNFYARLFEMPIMILLIALTCILVGYFEELFFRVYLIREFAVNSLTSHVTVVIGSFLFTAGHIYQGFTAAAGTFFIGMLLGYRYLAHSSWHEIALAHALYNFTAIILMPAVGR